MNNHNLYSTQSQKEQFHGFIKILAERYKPLYIYSFGSYTDSCTRNGCFIQDSAAENCQHYLLMVTESATRIENEVQSYVNDHFHDGRITILVHGKETLNDAIHANNRFFITVCNEGLLLYSHDKTLKSFQVPDFIPTQAAVKAKKHHRHHTTVAKGFLKGSLECLRSGHAELCTYMLHQVVEQCCIALIRVHLAYRSEIHNLYRLLRLCDSFSPELSALLIDDSEEGRRLFGLMAKSYSDARYKHDYKVEQSEAEKLYVLVSAFLEMTDILCLEKIESLAAEAGEYKLRKTESEVYCG